MAGLVVGSSSAYVYAGNLHRDQVLEESALHNANKRKTRKAAQALIYLDTIGPENSGRSTR
jgi:hypothetical protein